MNVVDVCAMAVAGGGTLAALVCAAATRSVRDGVRVGLELWMAAGLLHLAADAAWSAIGSAAAVILVRKLATSSLRTRPAA